MKILTAAFFLATTSHAAVVADTGAWKTRQSHCEATEIETVLRAQKLPDIDFSQYSVTELRGPGWISLRSALLTDDKGNQVRAFYSPMLHNAYFPFFDPKLLRTVYQHHCAVGSFHFDRDIILQVVDEKSPNHIYFQVNGSQGPLPIRPFHP